MPSPDPHLWTLEQLAAQVDAALAEGYQGSRNGQVSAIPSPRTIRYYTTLGIMDSPAEMRGRTAFYSRRHLLQLVAIKRLQEGGLALVTVQERLAGLSDPKLEAIARLDPRGAAAASPRSQAFWHQSPAAGASSAVDQVLCSGPESDLDSPVEEEAGDVSADLTARTLQEVSLGSGVRLTLPGRPFLCDADLLAIRVAAAQLMQVLGQRHLIPIPGE